MHFCYSSVYVSYSLYSFKIAIGLKHTSVIQIFVTIPLALITKCYNGYFYSVINCSLILILVASVRHRFRVGGGWLLFLQKEIKFKFPRFLD